MRFDQGSRVYVTPNPTYKKANKLTGICGNFNGLSQDDLLLRDKNTMAADDIEFGYEWRDEEDCPYPVSLDPCLENPDRQGWAEKGKNCNVWKVTALGIFAFGDGFLPEFIVRTVDSVIRRIKR